MMISNAASREVVATPRYRHLFSPASPSRVIIQWSRKGYGMYEGGGGGEEGEGSRPVPPGHAFIIVAPERSGYHYPKEAEEPWLIDWIDFVGPLASSLFARLRDQFGPVLPLNPKGAAWVQFRRLIAQWESGNRKDRWTESGEIYTFCLQWWQEVMNRDTPDRMIGIVQMLCQTTGHRLMTVKELAAECGMSREYFSRCFLRQTGVSPAVWLRERRLGAAAALFRQEPELTLAAVARQTGFATGRHLAAAFRRAYGMTTGEYRRSLDD